MTEVAIVSIISLFGFLVLAVSALRGRRMGARRGVTMAIAWMAIFAVVILFINLINR